MKKVRTTCAYCGVGCGILATDMDGKVHIEGDPAHPANHGKLCSKGLALGETLSPESRLTEPVIDGQVTNWTTATNTVARRLTATIAEHGPESVAFYVSGQLLTEDYYVANKLMKGFIGSANIDTNSRLCMASTVAGHKRAFGADVVPGDYGDLEEAELVVLVGSNLAWCHPVLFQRLRAAREACGTRIVVIDPRRTDSCDIADLHIPVMPGGDVLLFGGLLAHLHDAGKAPVDYTRQHVRGYEAAIAAAQADADAFADAVAARGIGEEVEEFFNLFARTEKVVTVFSQGVNQAHDGTDRVNAIINCHLATGRIGRAGMGPFSVTGQPNAMGGREVGGLANMLAAHMGFSAAERALVADFWQAPNLAHQEGLRAVDMFDAVHDGRIKAIWIMATNPAVSMPNAAKVREALANCPLVIVSDCVQDTDTQTFAHIRLPALGWGEKDGTVTNSDRTISRQRAFLPPFATARPDWRIISDVAAAMGWADAFNYHSPAEIFAEHASLSAYGNHGTRAFDIGAHARLNAHDYENLLPGKWPRTEAGESTARLFGDGGFFTSDGKARMLALRHRPRPLQPSHAHSLTLNTGRYRDQWHTMTRTGLSPTLMGHRAEPLLDISPVDAAHYGVPDGGFVRVETQHGAYLTRARLTRDQQPGEVFLPMHWSDTHAGAAVIGCLVPPEIDPVSAQPAFKSVPATITPVTMAWRALLFSRRDLPLRPGGYWSKAKLTHGTLMRMAGQRQDQLTELVGALRGDGEFLHMQDAYNLRHAHIRNGRLEHVLFAGSLTGVSIPWITSLLGQDAVSAEDRQTILAGHPPGPSRDPGPIVCACMQVGRFDIEAAILAQDFTDIDAVSACTGAGTGCGSCLPELKAILQQRGQHHAA